jgi:predicted outer membrane repeat protein
MRLRLAIGIFLGVSLAGLAGPNMANAASRQSVSVPCHTPALVAAISNATAGQTLSLAPLCTYILTSAPPRIGVDLTIEGHDATIERSTAPGTPEFSLLEIFSLLTFPVVTIDDVNFKDGDSSSSGGGINNMSGSVTVNGGTFSDDTALVGGAIYNSNSNEPDEQLTVRDSIFSDNSATFGGAIRNDGDATIIDCTFKENTSANDGGALLNTLNATLTGGSFSNNTAGAGGAVANIDSGDADLNVLGTAFTANKAGLGAAIVSFDFLSVTNSTFTRNIASESGGGVFNGGEAFAAGSSFIADQAGGDGAGIASENSNGIGIALTVSDSTFLGNIARGNGGGIATDDNGTQDFPPNTLSVSGGRIAGNLARSGQGGGIYNAGTTVTLSGNAVIAANHPDNCFPIGTIAGCTQ